MSRAKIIATAGAVVAATGLLIGRLMKENDDVGTGKGMENLVAELDEHVGGLATAQVRLQLLVAEDADDQSIVDAIYEMNRHGRALAVLSPLFGPGASAAPVLDFVEARDAIMTAIPKIDDEKPKAWALGQAQSMERRAMHGVAMAYADKGEAKITFNDQTETLVDGVPLKQWFLALQEKQKKESK